MEWTLAGLFVVAALLLIISISKARKTAKEEKKEMDMLHITTMNEIKEIRESIRNIELDMDIFRKEAGIQLSQNERLFIREVLDLYSRKYSVESIAAKKQVSENEIKQIVASYIISKAERSKVAHEI